MLLGVNVVIIREGGVLLTKREDYHVWCLPGGHVDPGESMAHAAMREVREETGFQVELTCLVGLYSRPHWKPDEYHIAVFTARITGGEMSPQPEEVIDLAFFDRDRLPERMLLGHRRRVLDAYEGRRGIVRCEEAVWPFDRPLARLEIYEERDRSGLPRDEFYERVMGSLDAAGSTVEIEGTVCRDLD